MFARNSDLYLEERESCWARSSSAAFACSISRFFRSTSTFWICRSRERSSSSSFVRCSSSCWSRRRSSEACSEFACCSSRLFESVSSPCCERSSSARDWDCFRSSSVRMPAAMVFSTMPIDSVSWSRKARWISEKRWNEASSTTAFTCPSNSTGMTTTFEGGASPRPEPMRR
jgi:hypothetical protein